mmetsp:Transcript_6278/g.8215  ORF Transcript_6278/g.8215 Transcript_6278/m.8215 type:complete len:250 (-) Transcript_6278:2389-3138(-)
MHNCLHVLDSNFNESLSRQCVSKMRICFFCCRNPYIFEQCSQMVTEHSDPTGVETDNLSTLIGTSSLFKGITGLVQFHCTSRPQTVFETVQSSQQSCGTTTNNNHVLWCSFEISLPVIQVHSLSILKQFILVWFHLDEVVMSRLEIFPTYLSRRVTFDVNEPIQTRFVQGITINTRNSLELEEIVPQVAKLHVCSVCKSLQKVKLDDHERLLSSHNGLPDWYVFAELVVCAVKTFFCSSSGDKKNIVSS